MSTTAQTLSVIFNTNIAALDPNVTPNEYVLNLLRDFLYQPASCFYNGLFLAQTAPTLVPLPASNAQVVWILNRSTTGASVLVSYTPAGGQPQTGPVLPPAGIFFLMNPTLPVAGGSLTGGITALSLSATANGTQCEVLVAGAGIPSGPSAPAIVTATAGSGQSVSIGAQFPIAFQATVLDTTGAPVPNVTVTFTAPATGASGTFAGNGASVTAVTNAQGIATAPAFSANGNIGQFSVAATVAGVAAPATFSLTNSATSPVAANIIVVTGSAQQVHIGTAFPVQMQAQVTNANNQPVANATVVFTAPTSGASGTFAGGGTTDTEITNNNGIATAAVFTANSTVGSYNVNATVSGVSTPAVFAFVNASLTVPATMVDVHTFGTIVGTGGDDTTAFQTGLNSTASAGQGLLVPAGNYKTGPLTVPSNAYMQVNTGATISDFSAYAVNASMLNIAGSNVTINGQNASQCVFQTPLTYMANQGTNNQSNPLMRIQGASLTSLATNINVTGISCNMASGDGIYIVYATNVTVQNCICNQNYRQGCSIIGGVNHIFLLASYFTNTAGTAPQCGIDIEPNLSTQYLEDVNITDCFTTGNAGDGILFSLQNLNSSTPAVAINILNHTSQGNTNAGYRGLNAASSNAPGTITITNSSSSGDGAWGAVGRFWASNGAALIFNGLTVTNPHALPATSGNYGDHAAVAIIRGGGGAVTQGNVQFNNITCQVNSNTDYYFNFQDFSNLGTVNATFSFTALSGAAKAPPNGLVQGVGHNTVP